MIDYTKRRILKHILTKRDQALRRDCAKLDFWIEEKILHNGILSDEELNNSFCYSDCWRSLLDLYLWLKHNRIEENKSNYPREYELLKRNMDIYLSLQRSERLNLDDLHESIAALNVFVEAAYRYYNR